MLPFVVDHSSDYVKVIQPLASVSGVSKLPVPLRRWPETEGVECQVLD